MATLTVYPDVAGSGNPVSGGVRRQSAGESWGSMVGGAGTSAFTDAANYPVYITAGGTSNQWIDCIRLIFMFDTSPLTSGATITAAVLSLYGHSKSDAGSQSPDVDIFTTTPASTTAIAASDFNTFGSVSQTGSPISYASWSTSGYNNFTFNSTGRGNISKTGTSKFGARNANYDAANSSPTWASGRHFNIGAYSAEAGGTSNDPMLVITYVVETPAATDSIKIGESENAFLLSTVNATESMKGVLSESAVVLGSPKGTDSLRAVLTESAVVSSIRLSPLAIELYLDGAWVDITEDVIGPMRIHYGAWDSGPTARIASTGTCEFALRNSARNSGGLAGYYSPGHTNCRSGFRRGIRFRVVLTYAGASYTKFTGKLHSIRPHGGLHGDQQTECMAVDWIDELANFDAREVDPQVSKRADELIAAVVAAMPTDAQPVSQNLSVGIDTFAYAMQDLAEGRNGLSLAADIVRSDFGYLSVDGDGTLRFFDREEEASLVDTLTLTDAHLRGVTVPSSLDQAYNVVRVVTHPLRLPTATIVLWQKATEDVPEVASGETITIWVAYRSPTNEDVLIGGQLGQFVSPVATTDYVANTSPTGAGSNITADITIVATFFATVAKLEITNANASAAYLTTLQVRGKGIYDLDDVTYESSSTQLFGRRPLEIDMPYADDGNVAQDIANYVRAQFDALDRYVTEIEIRAHYSPTVLSGVLSLEPGSGVTVSETMTGLTSVPLRINGVELVIMPPSFIIETARFAVAPRMVSDAGILDDAVRGLLDSTMIIGAL